MAATSERGGLQGRCREGLGLSLGQGGGGGSAGLVCRDREPPSSRSSKVERVWGVLGGQAIRGWHGVCRVVDDGGATRAA
jgi:hypothetical protein